MVDGRHWGLVVSQVAIVTQWQRRSTQALADVDPAPPLVTEPTSTAFLRRLPRISAIPEPSASRRSSACLPTSTVASAAARTRRGCRSPASTSTSSGRARTACSSRMRPGPDPGHGAARLRRHDRHHASEGALACHRRQRLRCRDGPRWTEMDRGETVTVFNDLVVLAPGAIIGAPIRWIAVDDRHARGVFTNGDQTVSAELTFDDDGDLVDFVSDDKLRASSYGSSCTRQRWSTRGRSRRARRPVDCFMSCPATCARLDGPAYSRITAATHCEPAGTVATIPGKGFGSWRGPAGCSGGQRGSRATRLQAPRRHPRRAALRG